MLLSISLLASVSPLSSSAISLLVTLVLPPAAAASASILSFFFFLSWTPSWWFCFCVDGPPVAGPGWSLCSCSGWFSSVAVPCFFCLFIFGKIVVDACVVLLLFYVTSQSVVSLKILKITNSQIFLFLFSVVNYFLEDRGSKNLPDFILHVPHMCLFVIFFDVTCQLVICWKSRR